MSTILGTVGLIVVAAVLALGIYFAGRYRRGSNVARHMRGFADAYDRSLVASGSKVQALSDGMEILRTCPRLSELTDSERARAIDLLGQVPDPKRVILKTLLDLTPDKALSALRNEQVLRELVSALNQPRRRTITTP